MKESLKTKVNLLVLKGTWWSLLPVCFLTSRALIHSLSANKLLLISAPSANLFLLLLWVSVALSEPAKSTKVNLAYSSSGWSISLTIKLHIAWLLEEVSFVTVLWVVLTVLA